MEESNLFNDQQLLNEEGANSLYEAAKWAKFLGIIGLAFIALMLIAGLFMGTVLSSAMAKSGSSMGAFSGTAISIIYFIMAALYFYPTWMLFKFGNSLRIAVRANNASLFNEALASLKRCFKFIAMLMILIIGLYLLAIVFFSIGSAFMR